MIKTLCLSFLMIGSLHAFGWGRIGHRIVAKVAQEQLVVKTQSKVRNILEGADLVAVANWPDEIKSDSNWGHAYSWHYVSIEDGKLYGASEKNKQGDLIEALERFCQDLKKKETPLKKKQEALKFVTHLMGDLHQPLHVGRSEDKGGNTIKLTWFGEQSNLHEVWDDGLIELEKLSYSEYVDLLHKTIKIDPKWKRGKVEDWAHEAMAYREQIYATKAEEKYWEYKYFYQHKNVLNTQLLKGGVRLASFIKGCLN